MSRGESGRVSVSQSRRNAIVVLTDSSLAALSTDNANIGLFTVGKVREQALYLFLSASTTAVC